MKDLMDTGMKDLVDSGTMDLMVDTGMMDLMDTGMMDQEDVEAMEVAEVMAAVILIPSLNLEVGIPVGEDHQAVEVMDIRGLRMVVV